MIALLFKDNPTPFFEVVGIVDGGRKMEVRLLWGNYSQRETIFTIDKAAYRAYGYYPKEIDDALIPQLQT